MGDPANSATAGAPGAGDSEPQPRAKRVECEFCECTIAKESGDVVKMSDKAKKYRELESENAKLKEKAVELQTALDATLHKDSPSSTGDSYTGPERRKRPFPFIKSERRKAASA